MRGLIGVFLGFAAASVLACAARAAGGPKPLQKVTVVIERPSVTTDRTGPFDVSVRIFEADDPDAPPQVSNIAVLTTTVTDITGPLAIDVEVSSERLAGALRPAVGAIVSSNGSLVYWTEMFVQLQRAGPTLVRLVPVP